jgi:5-methylcytosine-specific restriction endonuclease McrA
MPWAPPRTCPAHRLRLPLGRRCPACLRAYDQTRPAHFAFYTSAAWRALRAEVLAEQPWCAAGCGRPSVDVDHIVPRRIQPQRALDRANVQALCRACHGRKTKRAQG